MRRFRLPFILVAALLATAWGVGDARVPASMRCARGQVGRMSVVDVTTPDLVQPDASASQDPQHRPDSRRPAALPTATLVLPVLRLAAREQHRSAVPGVTLRTTLPHASRAPPRLG